MTCFARKPDRNTYSIPNACKCVLVVALTLSIAAFAVSAHARAIENARELANYCRSLEKGTKGTGRHILIPNTKEALLCWGYMQAIQDLSVLVDEDRHRLVGACPPEQITRLN